MKKGFVGIVQDPKIMYYFRFLRVLTNAGTFLYSRERKFSGTFALKLSKNRPYSITAWLLDVVTRNTQLSSPLEWCGLPWGWSGAPFKVEPKLDP